MSLVRTFVVQTAVMRDQMTASYPALGGRALVIPQPAPSWLKGHAPRPTYANRQALRLFYPAVGLPHKNHVLLRRMALCRGRFSPVEVTVTVKPTETAIHQLPGSWVRNVGKLEPAECLHTYLKSDALFFPSLLESYGLPLVEAMVLGMPVVCSDLPYARWLCEEEALYFDPLSPQSAWQALSELRRRLDAGWSPDWTRALSKLPRNWDEVAARFLEIMGLGAGRNGVAARV
jgi:glycosyltransferase involved in cell wall biosynthesis